MENVVACAAEEVVDGRAEGHAGGEIVVAVAAEEPHWIFPPSAGVESVVATVAAEVNIVDKLGRVIVDQSVEVDLEVGAGKYRAHDVGLVRTLDLKTVSADARFKDAKDAAAQARRVVRFVRLRLGVVGVNDGDEVVVVQKVVVGRVEGQRVVADARTASVPP